MTTIKVEAELSDTSDQESEETSLIETSTEISEKKSEKEESEKEESEKVESEKEESEKEESEKEESEKESEKETEKESKKDVDKDDCIYTFSNIDEDDDDYESDIVSEPEKITISSDIYVLSEDRITKPYFTKYEIARILGDRTKQLIEGAKPLIKNYKELNHKEIARAELKLKILPYYVHRPLPSGKIERWKINELEII